MIRVMLADDHELVRSGIKMLLESDPEIHVVAEAADGEQAYAVAVRERPDVLLLDISMPPGESGLVVCERIAKELPDTKVVILTMFAELDYLYYTLRGGAAGYVVKSATAEELVAAVREVHAGGVFIHPKMAALISQNLRDEADRKAGGHAQLTSRELEILQLLARGYTNKEIAAQVYLSVKTVEAHRSKIYEKLGITSRAELVSYALEHKLLGV